MDKDTALDLALGALEVGWSPTYTGLDAKEMGMKAITAIKQARSAPVQPVAWPAGLIDRIKAAEQRIQDGHAPRRIPADPTDVDLVLAEVRYLLEGKQPPFWIKTTPPAQRPFVGLTDEEISDIAINNPPMVHEFARAIEAKLKEKNDG